MKEAPSFEGAFLVPATPPIGKVPGAGTWMVWVSAAGTERLQGGVRVRGGRSPGCFAGQALGMGRRLLLRERGTQHGTLDGDCRDFRL